MIIVAHFAGKLHKIAVNEMRLLFIFFTIDRFGKLEETQ